VVEPETEYFDGSEGDSFARFARFFESEVCVFSRFLPGWPWEKAPPMQCNNTSHHLPENHVPWLLN